MFINHYACPKCGYTWSDIWSCMVDDDCPGCGCRHISPAASESLQQNDSPQDDEVSAAQSF